MDLTTLEDSRLLVTIASFLLTIGLWVQMIKMWRTRSVDDFAPLLLAALLFNEVSWLNYGILLNEWPIWLVAGANLPAVIGAIIGYFKYRHHKAPSGQLGGENDC